MQRSDLGCHIVSKELAGLGAVNYEAVNIIGGLVYNKSCTAANVS